MTAKKIKFICNSTQQKTSADEFIFYNKKQLFDTISTSSLSCLQGFTSDLVNIISDYCYRVKYVKYKSHESLCWVKDCFYKSTRFDDYLIEIVDSTCYVHNIVTNKFVKQCKIPELGTMLTKSKKLGRFYYWSNIMAISDFVNLDNEVYIYKGLQLVTLFLLFLYIFLYILLFFTYNT